MSEHYDRLMDEAERDWLNGNISYAEACAIADHASVAQGIMRVVGAEAEKAAQWFDVIKMIDESYQAEIHQPLPHHQTSLVRLNHHANGGKK